MSNAKAIEVSIAILNQLGGNKFKAMTGAKEFGYSVMDNGNINLTFKIGKNSEGVSHVSITLNGRDLYDVEFLKVSIKKGRVVLKSLEDVYAEDLQDIFVTNTGLLTRLGA
jgi:hypothetical protein